MSSIRDINTINCYYDRISQENKVREVFLKKRPGLATTAYNLSKSVSTDVLRGHYYYPASNKLYWAVNNKVYSANPDTNTTIRTVCTLATSSGYVGFCEFLKASNNKGYVVISDGTDLWVDDVAGASCVEVTVDADLPSPHIPCPVSLDGYIFLAKSSTGDMYNCDNDDPTSWTSGDFISTEMSGDFIIKLAQNRNYILAFGTNSLEMFWDPANTSGSPMRRNDQGYKDIRYVTGLAKIGNSLYFVGQDSSRNIAVYMLDGFDVKKISNSVVERSIQTITTTDNAKSSLNLDKNGYTISSDGHTFYVIVTPQTTWAFDIETGFWFEWNGEIVRLGKNGIVMDKQRLTAGSDGALQPVVLVKNSSEALGLMRYSGASAPRRAISVASSDGGQNWSAPEKSALPNPNSALTAILLADGRILAVLNNQETGRDALSLVISADGGKTWKTVHRLEDQTGTRNQPPSESSFLKITAQLSRESGAKESDADAYAESARRQSCIQQGCRFEFSYPYLIQAQSGEIHLV